MPLLRKIEPGFPTVSGELRWPARRPPGELCCPSAHSTMSQGCVLHTAGWRRVLAGKASGSDAGTFGAYARREKGSPDERREPLQVIVRGFCDLPFLYR